MDTALFPIVGAANCGSCRQWWPIESPCPVRDVAAVVRNIECPICHGPVTWLRDIRDLIGGA